MTTSEPKKPTADKVGMPMDPIDASSIDASSISEEGKEEKKKFRLSAKNVCLHYPKGHGLTHQSILEQLTTIFAGGIKNYLIAMECSTEPRSRHLDKSLFHVIDRELYHFHVLLEFCAKVNITNPFGFDILGSNGEQVHGHYHTTKKREAVLRYFSKEDKNILTSFALDADGNEKTREDLFMESLSKIARERGINAAMKEFSEKRPWLIATRYNAVKTNLTQYVKSFPEPVKSRFPTDSFNRLPELENWYENFKDTHSAVLVGKGGVGKTEMIISFLNSRNHSVFLCRNTNDLTNLNADYDVVLFDDINTAKMNVQEKIQLFDVERPSSIRILYETKKIAETILKAFTINKLESLIPRKDQKDEALMRRVNIIHVDKPLFRDMNINITTNNYFAAPKIDKNSSIKKVKKSKVLLEDNVVEGTIVEGVQVKKVKTKYISMSKVKKKKKTIKND